LDFKIIGLSGADTIVGGAGADIINGLGGNDTMTGNGGADEFHLSSGNGTDTITVLTHNVDKLSFFSTNGVSSYSSFSAIQNNDDNKIVILSVINQTTALFQNGDAGQAPFLPCGPKPATV
jgi:Ca2+-binding RTX toxin-like protein